jgi:hypothetical protein
VGETRVDLQHLLEDLRDADCGALEETILTEVVANALDSGARRIRILANPAAAPLTERVTSRVPRCSFCTALDLDASQIPRS